MKEAGTHLKVETRACIKNLIGPQIRLVREKRGWTQHELANLFQTAGLRMSRDIIASIETQRSPVTDIQIVLFARILGISWKSLFPDKTGLERFQSAAGIKKSSSEGNSQKDKAKPLASTRLAVPAPKHWSICKMTCKSLKITFRRAD